MLLRISLAIKILKSVECSVHFSAQFSGSIHNGSKSQLLCESQSTPELRQNLDTVKADLKQDQDMVHTIQEQLTHRSEELETVRMELAHKDEEVTIHAVVKQGCRKNSDC